MSNLRSGPNPSEQGGGAVTLERRKELLAECLALFVAQGYSIEEQDNTMAVLVIGRRLNRMNWFLDGCLVGGVGGIFLWPFIALIVSLVGKRRYALNVDEDGNVTMREVRARWEGRDAA